MLSFVIRYLVFIFSLFLDFLRETPPLNNRPSWASRALSQGNLVSTFLRNQTSGLVIKICIILEFFSSKIFLSSFLF